MRVYVYPAGLDGCGNYRMIWPAQALSAQGHDVTLVMPHDRTAQQRYQISGRMIGDKIVDVIHPPDADVMVFQRVTHKNLARAIPILVQKGITVVVDMDDDLTRVHPQNPAYRYMHPKTGGEHSWVNASYACEQASLVTVSTPQLLNVYGRHGRAVVLYNMIQERNLSLLNAHDGTFGWTGNLQSHPDDPTVCGSAVGRLVGEGFRFRMVGNPWGVEKIFRLPADSMQTDGVLDGAVWAEGLTRLYVGMAPLADSTFNRAKSWLKPQELASVGVPCVVSPRAEYVRLSTEHGIGILAPSPRDWYRELRRLLTDERWREEMSQKGREAVAELTVEKNAWRWLEAWDSAYRAVRSTRSPLFG